MATKTSTTDFDNAEITQQYSRINTRFELFGEDLDNDNSSARLFERSRIKALAGESSQSDIKLSTCCFGLDIQSPQMCKINTYTDVQAAETYPLLPPLTSQDHLHIPSMPQYD